MCGEREPLIPIKFAGATDDGLEQIERRPVIASPVCSDDRMAQTQQDSARAGHPIALDRITPH
jgi:hypothetical protein